MTAFLAHRAVLRRLPAPNAAQRELLQAMEKLLDSLDVRDRAALDGAESHRRERAERNLLHLLCERGVVSG